MPNQLKDMQEIVYKNNVKHGWFDKDRAFGDDIALLHSEVSEAYEAYRKGYLAEVDDNGDYNPSCLSAEVADVLIRLLDTCQRYDIDLMDAFLKKMKYNASRPYRHGNKAV
jgi:NTP pyrophosphatase (non-canonical NTP hydrolase)